MSHDSQTEIEESNRLTADALKMLSSRSFGSSQEAPSNTSANTQTVNIGIPSQGSDLALRPMTDEYNQEARQSSTGRKSPHVAGQMKEQSPIPPTALELTRSESPFKDPSNKFLKQIGSQRRPMFTPAVLRPTNNGMSVSEEGKEHTKSDLSLYREYNHLGQPSANQDDCASSYASSVSTTEYNHQVNKPTRSHWKPDGSSFKCHGCGKILHCMTPNRRKHHCRKCGEIYCGSCLRNKIYVDEMANFVLLDEGRSEEASTSESPPLFKTSINYQPTTEAEKYFVKACYNCFLQYDVFLTDHLRNYRKEALQYPAADSTKNYIDELLQTEDGVQAERRASVATVNNIVGSVPADWNWSSF